MENLKKLPKNTKIFDANGLRFSCWAGQVALVCTNSAYFSSKTFFNAETIERRYVVRFALDMYTREPMAFSDTFDCEPHVFDETVNYEDTGFSIRDRVGRQITGRFSEPHEFSVKIPVSQLFPQEHVILTNSLIDRGYYETTALTKKDWNQILKDGLENCEFEDRKLREASHLYGRRFSGVFSRAKNGSVKFVTNQEIKN